VSPAASTRENRFSIIKNLDAEFTHYN